MLGFESSSVPESDGKIANGNLEGNTDKSQIQGIFNQRMASDKSFKLEALLNRAQAYSNFLAARLREQISLEGEGGEVTSKETENVSSFQQPKTLTGGTLRGYQLEGVQWLVSLFENGLNGILADEMGLGKTFQCIGFLAFLREQGIWGPFLVVAPLSTLSNWISEIQRFCPTMPALMYHGSIPEREAMRRKHLTKIDKKKTSVIVTSYEIAMKDARFLSTIQWKYLIIDEGHRLKNFNCRLMRELKSYKSDNRLLITGTPLQNNLSELWSLLNFLLPEIFNDIDDFLEWFSIDTDSNGSGGFSDEENQRDMVSRLHSILKPLLLRRLKLDVEKDLPLKVEYLVTATLSPLQKEYYKLVLDGKVRDLVASKKSDEEGNEGKNKRKRVKNYIEPTEDEFLESASETSTSELIESESEVEYPINNSNDWSAAQGLQNRIMQLRKVCNHPYLFKYPTCPNDPTSLKVDEGIVTGSGKMQLLDQILPKLLKTGHKVLIFSQMSRMLDILEDYLGWKGLGYSRIDGSVSQVLRQEEIKRFREDKGCNVFLLSTRAGGLGINLTAADTVIFYDSDWNPQMDLQAQDRVHRIGQDKPVLVIRFTTGSATVEGRMLEAASSKRKLERLVILKRKFKGRQQLLGDDAKLAKEELAAILKSDDRLDITANEVDESPLLSHEEISHLLNRLTTKNIKDTPKLHQVT